MPHVDPVCAPCLGGYSSKSLQCVGLNLIFDRQTPYTFNPYLFSELLTFDVF